MERTIQVAKRVLFAVDLCLMMFLQYFQMHYSAFPGPHFRTVSFWSQGALWIGVNCLIVAAVNLLLAALIRSWPVTLVITSFLASLWSVADYFVIQFHGSPLFPSEFSNIKAAANVAGNYTYNVDDYVQRLLILAGLELLGILFLLVLRLELPRGIKAFALWMGLAAVSFGALFVLLFSPAAVKPASTLGWSWKAGTEKYGVLVEGVENLSQSVNMRLNPNAYFARPDGYDARQLEATGEDDAADPASGVMPDIIFILNETFCDLDLYFDIQSDVPALERFYQIDRAVYGYSVSSQAGGGTNDSEYQLLTSNSMYLLKSSAPFNFVDLAQTDENIVQYLERLGYQTWGMHCIYGGNYNRTVAYEALGFDHILLGSSGFQHRRLYGQRPWYDSDNYLDLIDQYESDTSGSPKFMYLLTYQNHGGYDQNDPSLDTVHTALDYGDYTEWLNEYLTSVQMSGDAFVELTDYFSTVEHPVIICMVGDHVSPFYQQLNLRGICTEEEYELICRTVPYVIWANFEIDTELYTDYASMEDLVPMVVSMAGLPCSDYYNAILELHQAVPIRTSYGGYRDRTGRLGTYCEDSPYYELMNRYYRMEYNALIAGEQYRAELFQP